MNPEQQEPIPIIDNLAHMGNPFKQKSFSAKRYLEKEMHLADADLEYAFKFLYSYNGSTATYNSYRREIERLLQWCWRIEEISVMHLKREHIEEFIQFCSNPPITWIGTKNVARFKLKQGERIANKDWRPFVTTVSKIEFRQGIEANPKQFYQSQSAIKAIFTALSSFYEYLIQENLIESNPVALIKQKSKFIRKDQISRVDRHSCHANKIAR